MGREATEAADAAKEAARIVEAIGDMYDTISPEGWALARKLLAVRSMDNARKCSRDAAGDR